MKLPQEIEIKKEKLFELCQKYSVLKLYAFGSVLSNSFNNESDIDLIVELQNFSPVEKGENLMKLWSELEYLFLRKVDLLTNKNIKNPYLKKEIDKTKTLLYDKIVNRIVTF